MPDWQAGFAAALAALAPLVGDKTPDVWRSLRVFDDVESVVCGVGLT